MPASHPNSGSAEPQRSLPSLPPVPWGGPYAGLFELPLLPLRAVLFPDGLMQLTVQDERFSAWLQSSFEQQACVGVVGQRKGAQPLEAVGVVAEVVQVRPLADHSLQLRCRGWQRFHIQHAHQLPDARWSAQVELLPLDPTLAPTPAQHGSVKALATAIAAIKAQDAGTAARFASPYRFDDAGWVANRWCEILPIQQEAKQRLMELNNPANRLDLVNEYLRGQGVLID
jgi:Lon protease-like protein